MTTPTRESANMMADAVAEAAHPLGAARGSVAMTKPAKPFRTMNWLKSCDNCFYQEGRHYCLLMSEPVKNMDTLRCDDWKERQNDKLCREQGEKDSDGK